MGATSSVHRSTSTTIIGSSAPSLKKQGKSQGQSTKDVTIPFEQLIDYIMPVYFTKIPLQTSCKELIIASWKLILTNQAEGFHERKKMHSESTPCKTSMEFFSNRLVQRLMEVHPVCIEMFSKPSLKQGTLFMNMFSFLVKEIDHPELLQKQLRMVAISHCKMGIRATEFGIFGEVLFWTLRLVLGPKAYDQLTHRAWIKFFSWILQMIVPIVLKSEIDHYQDHHHSASDPHRHTETTVPKANETIRPSFTVAHEK